MVSGESEDQQGVEIDASSVRDTVSVGINVGQGHEKISKGQRNGAQSDAQPGPSKEGT